MPSTASRIQTKKPMTAMAPVITPISATCLTRPSGRSVSTADPQIRAMTPRARPPPAPKPRELRERPRCRGQAKRMRPVERAFRQGSFPETDATESDRVASPDRTRPGTSTACLRRPHVPEPAISSGFLGADDGDRTRDPQLGKPSDFCSTAALSRTARQRARQSPLRERRFSALVTGTRFEHSPNSIPVLDVRIVWAAVVHPDARTGRCCEWAWTR
jgi:hypothetical protein